MGAEPLEAATRPSKDLLGRHRGFSSGCARPQVYENIADTLKGGPSEDWILFFRCVCELVRAVAESSNPRNAAHTGWQAPTLRARAADRGRKAGP